MDWIQNYNLALSANYDPYLNNQKIQKMNFNEKYGILIIYVSF